MPLNFFNLVKPPLNSVQSVKILFYVNKACCCFSVLSEVHSTELWHVCNWYKKISHFSWSQFRTKWLDSTCKLCSSEALPVSTEWSNNLSLIQCQLKWKGIISLLSVAFGSCNPWQIYPPLHPDIILISHNAVEHKKYKDISRH